MELQGLNTPPPSEWLYLAAAVAPPSGPPFVRRNARRRELRAQLTQLVTEARELPGVEQVGLFRAVLMPPFGAAVRRPARYDVAVLVQVASPMAADLTAQGPVARMLDAMRAAQDVTVMPARCRRYLAAVDHTRQGLFPFNHFAHAAGEGERLDLESATRLWEHLAGWYVAETGLTNSTLLGPTEQSDFLFVNHARWDGGPARFMTSQSARGVSAATCGPTWRRIGSSRGRCCTAWPDRQVPRQPDRPDPVPDDVRDQAAAHYDEKALAGLLLWIASRTCSTGST